MSLESPLTIAFPGVSAAEANRAAASLVDALRDIDPSVVVEVVRERPDTQDLGTLVLILGTPSAIALAKGIASWIARTSTKIEIRKDGTVIATGLESKDAAKIADAFAPQ